jgi:hypothetical protein
MEAALPLTADAINESVIKHSLRFKMARERFRIALPRGVYPERSISYFYIGALAEALNGGTAIAEVPFDNAEGSKLNNHLDAIVFNDHCAILAEFKRSWTPAHWMDLASDIERVDRFANKLLTRFHDNRPRMLFSFFGTDAWRSEVANAWKSDGSYKNWTVPSEFQNMKFGSIKVWNGDDDLEELLRKNEDGYYWLWACKQLELKKP